MSVLISNPSPGGRTLPVSRAHSPHYPVQCSVKCTCLHLSIPSPQLKESARLRLSFPSCAVACELSCKLGGRRACLFWVLCLRSHCTLFLMSSVLKTFALYILSSLPPIALGCRLEGNLIFVTLSWPHFRKTTATVCVHMYVCIQGVLCVFFLKYALRKNSKNIHQTVRWWDCRRLPFYVIFWCLMF